MDSMLNQLREQRLKFAETPVNGERFVVPREGTEGIDTIIYRPKKIGAEKLPVLFNLHGGAWVAGDAVLMDSFCTLMAEEIPAVVVNVNYKKIDVHPFPYPQTELRDAVLYFADHAVEYSVDKAKFAIGGHSAGAHITSGAAIMLKESGFKLACQVLVYPFVDFTMEVAGEEANQLKNLTDLFFTEVDKHHYIISPLQAELDKLEGLAPAIIIVCGKDTLKPHGVGYAKRLIDAAVSVMYKEYPDALHGFLEVNRKEYEGDPRRSPGQLEMTRDCERYLINELRALFS